MVTRRQQSSAKRGADAENASGIVEEFISKLAVALQGRGKRTWKTKEVTKAVELAVAALPDAPLKISLQDSLAEAVTQLLQLLQPTEEAAEVKPKRAKRAKTAPTPQQQQQEQQQEQQLEGAAAAPTLLDASLEAVVEAILSGDSDTLATIHPSSVLLSRFPPPEGLLEWQILQNNGNSIDDINDEDAVSLLAAAEKALPICSALAGQASLPEEALSVFSPALALMERAVKALEQTLSSSAAAAAWKQFEVLSSRALMCMHLVMKEIGAVNEAEGTLADRNSQWWRQSTTASTASEETTSNMSSSALHLDGARKTCAIAVALCARAAVLHQKNSLSKGTAGGTAGGTASAVGGMEELEKVAAAARHGMQLLTPHAATGHIIAAAGESVVEEVKTTKMNAQLFLALYLATVDQDLSDARFYFLQMMAARNAAAVATFLSNPSAAARLMNSAAAVTPPPAALDWLHNQPPSGIVLHALESLQRGPQGLSAHLIYEAAERAVLALAGAAATAGGVAGTAQAVGGDEGIVPEDDLLFFVSKEGDGGGKALVEEEWEEEEEEAEAGGGGIDLNELPDEGEEVLHDDGASDDEDDEDE